MDVQIRIKGMQLESETKNYIQKKIGKLDRYLTGITAIKVEVHSESGKKVENKYSMKSIVQGKGFVLKGEEKGADILGITDRLAEIMTRRIGKEKGKKYQKHKGAQKEDISNESTHDETPFFVKPRIVKVKKYSVKPMTVNEASEQMESLGHDFFIFANFESGKISVLYGRHDGNYGLIEPEIA